MKKKKRLKLIKVLLSYIIEKNREEENFVGLLNENNKLYDINVSSKIDNPFYEIAKELGIEDEEKAEEIQEIFNRKSLNIDSLVEEFCKKYNI